MFYQSLFNFRVLNFQKLDLKGSSWIRLVFAHPFPSNSGAPLASGNFISDGKVQVASSWILMTEPAQLMGTLLFKTNLWAQSNPYPVRPFVQQLLFSRVLVITTTNFLVPKFSMSTRHVQL